MCAFVLTVVIGYRPAVPAQGAPSLAIVNGTVITMQPQAPLVNHTVLTVDDRITAVGPASQVTVPNNATIVDAGGKFVTPGLVDFHVHLRDPWELQEYLRHGVITVVAMQGTQTALRLRDVARFPAPHVLTSGPLIDGDPPIWPGDSTRVVVNAAQAAEAADWHCTAGVDFVKVYNNLDPDLLAVISQRVHACGLMVAGHLPRRRVRSLGLDRGLSNPLRDVAALSRPDVVIVAGRVIP